VFSAAGVSMGNENEGKKEGQNGRAEAGKKLRSQTVTETFSASRS